MPVMHASGAADDAVDHISARSQPSAVGLHAVTKRFGNFTAVDNVSVDVRPGEFLALLGPSGCGKTTCLRLMAGLESPEEGRILVGGRDVTAVPPGRRGVNTVFQSYALFGHLSVLRNVEFGLRQRGVGKRERQRRAHEALVTVRLDHLADRRPSQLSGGQQQRVALARALVLEPEVLLLDEPLAALDLQLRKEMQIELKRLHRESGCSFVFVTHDQGEAMAMADRVAVMSAGRIEQLDTPARVYDSPATAFVAGFIGDMNTWTGHCREGAVEMAGARMALPGVGVPEGPVIVGVRPEFLQVGLAPPGAITLDGRLRSVSVLGDAIQVLLDHGLTDNRTSLVAKRPRSEQAELESLPPGDQTTVWFTSDRAVIFPDSS